MLSYSVAKGHDTGSVVMASDLVGRTGFEPVTSSVSGKFAKRSCFRFLVTTCGYWSMRVHWCPSLSAAIVTQLVTRL